MYLRGVKRVARVRRVDFPPHRRKSKGLAHLRETDRVAKVVSPALAALLFYRREKPLSEPAYERSERSVKCAESDGAWWCSGRHPPERARVGSILVRSGQP